MSRMRPIVYGSVSASALSSSERRAIDLRPPARRADLDALERSSQPGVVIVLDGLFGRQQAVTTAECGALLTAGWTVIGASSIGALRAAELWSLGMIGVGDIYTMLRLGRVTSDAELAVLYSEDLSTELTIALVHVRAALSMETRRRPHLDVAKLFRLAADIHWTERSLTRLSQDWLAVLNDSDLHELLRVLTSTSVHPKIADGALAVRSALADLWATTRTYDQ